MMIELNLDVNSILVGYTIGMVTGGLILLCIREVFK